jgi:AcrR family transcriptional regulator
MTDARSGHDATAAGKRLRADARRNRARILEVAETVLSAKGASASTEEIARAAGVGIGTVFRHFPTKEDLLEAVFVGHMRRLADEAEALSTGDDPGAAFFGFFARVVQGAPTKLAFADALVAAGVDVHSAAARTADDLRQALGALLKRAQRAGAVRDDVRLPEVYALLIGMSRAAAYGSGDSEVHARSLEIVFAGLRAHNR